MISYNMCLTVTCVCFSHFQPRPYKMCSIKPRAKFYACFSFFRHTPTTARTHTHFVQSAVNLCVNVFISWSMVDDWMYGRKIITCVIVCMYILYCPYKSLHVCTYLFHVRDNWFMFIHIYVLQLPIFGLV